MENTSHKTRCSDLERWGYLFGFIRMAFSATAVFAFHNSISVHYTAESFGSHIWERQRYSHHGFHDIEKKNTKHIEMSVLRRLGVCWSGWSLFRQEQAGGFSDTGAGVHKLGIGLLHGVISRVRGFFLKRILAQSKGTGPAMRVCLVLFYFVNPCVLISTGEREGGRWSPWGSDGLQIKGA